MDKVRLEKAKVVLFLIKDTLLELYFFNFVLLAVASQKAKGQMKALEFIMKKHVWTL